MLLGMGVGVCAIRQKAGIIPVHHIVDVVLGEQLRQEVWRQVVGHICTQLSSVRCAELSSMQSELCMQSGAMPAL